MAMWALTLTAGQADELRVAAAANLQKAFTEAIIPQFQTQTGVMVVPTYGSTKLLAKQIEQGAPVDVFVAADTTSVDKLAVGGLVVPETETIYAIGHLVIWTRKDAARHPRKIEDLTDPGYVKISIANPALAPYGLAAQQSFDSAKITTMVTPKLVMAENIQQALQYGQSGNSDASLTALSLVIEDKDDPYIIVPDKLHASIAQSAAVVKSSTQQDLAKKFLAFLTNKKTAKIWKRYGYSVPTAPKKA
jgi:molybdate transport system substrate-binding protein